MHCCTLLDALAEDRVARKPVGGTPQTAERCPSPEAEIHMLQSGCTMHARPSSLLLLELCWDVFLAHLVHDSARCAYSRFRISEKCPWIFGEQTGSCLAANFREARLGAPVFVGLPAWPRFFVMLASHHLCVDALALFGVPCFLVAPFWD